MKQWALFLFVLACVSIPVPGHSPLADSNSCVACHTDGPRLKSLVVPPQIGGEGEG